ncbi:MAG: polysaccharide biosynthesis/export family protein [Pseudomonadota bacterium]
MLMTKSIRRAAQLIGAVTVLTGCGVVYTSPSVSTGSTFGDTSNDFKVSIVPLTYETTASANLDPYIPSRLPLGFAPKPQSELSSRSAIRPRQLGPAPAPASQFEPRPGFVPDNLPPATPPQPYTIGVADVLLLSVNTAGASLESLPGLISAQSKRQGFVVQDDGAIAIPDAGRVRVAGLTMQDAEAEIFQSLVTAGIDPSFSLEIAEFNSQRVSVGGQVRTAALVPITLKPLYLHEAISAAGGMVIEDPDIAKIQIFRGGQSYQVSTRRFLADASVRQLLMLDGDSIYVGSDFNEARARARFQEQIQLRAQQQNAFNFEVQSLNAQLQLERTRLQLEQEQISAERDLFKDRLELGAVKRDYAYLAGEVIRPLQYALPFENKAVLSDLLFSGNGLSIRTADYGEIYVLRRPVNPEAFGAVTAYHLDAENAVNLALASMFEMHAGDVVFVAEQPITAWNRVLSQIVPTIFTGLANTANNLAGN